MIKLGVRYDGLRTYPNAILAIAKVLLGEQDKAKKIVKNIESKIGYKDGLIKLGVRYDGLRTYPNAILAIAFLVLACFDKACFDKYLKK